MTKGRKTYRTLIVVDCLGPFNAGQFDTLEELHYATQQGFSLTYEDVACYEVCDGDLAEPREEHGGCPELFGVDGEVPLGYPRLEVRVVPEYRVSPGRWERERIRTAWDMVVSILRRHGRPESRESIVLAMRLEKRILRSHPSYRSDDDVVFGGAR